MYVLEVLHCRHNTGWVPRAKCSKQKLSAELLLLGEGALLPQRTSMSQEAQELVATQAGQGTGSPRTRRGSDPEAWRCAAQEAAPRIQAWRFAAQEAAPGIQAWRFAAPEAAPGIQAWILSLAQHQQSNREALLATGKEVNTVNGPEQETTKVEGSPHGACMDGLYCGQGACPRPCLEGAGSSCRAR